LNSHDPRHSNDASHAIGASVGAASASATVASRGVASTDIGSLAQRGEAAARPASIAR
jgi:hypothetical protein